MGKETSDQSWECRDCFPEEVLGENVLTQGTVRLKPDGKAAMVVWLGSAVTLNRKASCMVRDTKTRRGPVVSILQEEMQSFNLRGNSKGKKTNKQKKPKTPHLGLEGAGKRNIKERRDFGCSSTTQITASKGCLRRLIRSGPQVSSHNEKRWGRGRKVPFRHWSWAYFLVNNKGKYQSACLDP